MSGVERDRGTARGPTVRGGVIGVVGGAIGGAFDVAGQTNLIGRSSSELNPCDRNAVFELPPK